MRARQLLDRGQRHERVLHSVSCGDVQREHRVECWSGVPCRVVLPCGLQLVERERTVRARQLLDCGQRHERVLHSVSCGDV